MSKNKNNLDNRDNRDNRDNQKTPLARKTRKLSPEVELLVEYSTSHETRRSYGGGFRIFSAWCCERGLCPLPAEPETVAEFLAVWSKHWKISTLRQRLSMINQAHAINDLPVPGKSALVQKVVKGLNRTMPSSQKKATPLMVEHLREICAGLDKEIENNEKPLTARRDKALFLVGFAGAFRRGELVSLKIEDIEFEDRGMKIHLRRSKTDQTGKGAIKAIANGKRNSTCPVRALSSWLECLEAQGAEKDRPVFCRIRKGQRFQPNAGKGFSEQSAYNVIRQRTNQILGMGYGVSFSGHSLRRGFINEGVERNIPERSLIKTTGHKSISTFRDYIDEFDVWRDNETGNLGL